LTVSAASGAQVSHHSDAAKKLTNLNFGVSSKSINLIPQYLAQKLGFYKKHGLNVNLQFISAGGPATVAAVISGSTPIAVTSVDLLWNYLEQGAPLLGITQEIQGNQMQICLRPSVAAARGITRTTPTKTMLQDLHGLTMGGMIPGNVFTVLLNGLLSKYGLPLNTFVEDATQGSAVDSLMAAGAIDGAPVSSPVCEVAEQGGYGKVVWNLTDQIKQFKIAAYGMDFTTTSYAKSHPKVIADFIAAVNDAHHWMAKHKKQVVQYAISAFGVPPAYAAQAIAEGGYTSTTKIPAIGMRNALDVANSFGVTTHPVSNQLEQISYSNRYYKYPPEDNQVKVLYSR